MEWLEDRMRRLGVDQNAPGRMAPDSLLGEAPRHVVDRSLLWEFFSQLSIIESMRGARRPDER